MERMREAPDGGSTTGWDRMRMDAFDDYAKKRDTTRRKHVVEIVRVFGFRPFGAVNIREFSRRLSPVAEGTDSGEALVGALVEEMRR